MKNIAKIVALVAVLACSPSFASEVSELVLSIVSGTSDAGRAEVKGQEAEGIQGITGSKHPVFLNFKGLKKLPEPYCRHIQMQIDQDGVVEKSGRIIRYQGPWLNMYLCADGHNPQMPPGEPPPIFN